MGKLKDSVKVKETYKEFSLSSYDEQYLKEMAKTRNAVYNNIQGLIQAHLSYLAASKWGYKENQLLEFELDVEKHLVKVTIKEE